MSDFSLLRSRRYTSHELIKEFRGWWSFRHVKNDLKNHFNVFENIPSLRSTVLRSPDNMSDLNRLIKQMTPAQEIIWEQNKIYDQILEDYNNDPKIFNFKNIKLEIRVDTYRPYDVAPCFNFLGVSCAICAKIRKSYGDEKQSLHLFFRGHNEFIRRICPLCVDCEYQWYKFTQKKSLYYKNNEQIIFLFLKEMIKNVGNSH